MRSLVCSTILIAVTLHTASADNWTPLFNGVDLTGWKANNNPEAFTVKEGLLRVQARGETAAHLFYVGDLADGTESFKNFELKAVVRSERNSNGGIFFHTDMSVRNAQKHLANGYEVQLNSAPREKRKTGSLYAVVDLLKSPVDETKWFTVRLIVKDSRITVFVADKKVIDYLEPPGVKRPPERNGRRLRKNGGAIALQAHDQNSVWYFKDIQIRKLR